ncbi:MAG: hypothetical protein ACJ74D_11170 [Gaiellaceae bacterium]
MTELERALVALGEELEFPSTPDVWPRVSGRLQRRRWFRPALAAVALAVLALGIAFAVPDARSAILRFFHVGAATVERVETLPPAQQGSLVSGLGAPVSHATLRLPSGVIATRYYERPGLDAALVRYRGKRLLVAEVEGDQMAFFKKVTGPTTRIEEVPLGEFGLYISGAPHVLMWQFRSGEVREARTRLAGSVIVWLSNDVTYRIEGDLDQSQMLELARQITR